MRSANRETTTAGSIAYLEFKRATGKRYLTLGLIFASIILLMAHVGMGEYKAELEEVEITDRLEAAKSPHFYHYRPYSVYGIRFVCMPSSLDFLLTFQAYDRLGSAIDTGTKLALFQSKKGNDIIPQTSAGYLNFSGLLLILGSLIALLYGYPAFINNKYLRYLCSLKTFRELFFSILFTRMLLFSLYILLLFQAVVLLALLHGITIAGSHFYYFVLLTLLLLNFFLLVGAATGSVYWKQAGIAFMVTVYIMLNILAPWFIVKTVKNISVSISEHQTEYDKLKLLMLFERRGVERFGKLRKGEEVKKFLESYLKIELSLLEDIEANHRGRVLEKIEKYRNLTLFLPTTFYLSSVSEISGKGYLNYNDFYDFALKKKRKFIEFYFEKVYFSTLKKGAVESFIKPHDTIFYLKSRVPRNFVSGIILITLYSLLFVVFLYKKTYKKIYHLKPRLPGEDQLFIHLVKGRDTFLFTGDPLLKAKIYNHFSGKESLDSDISFVPEAGFDITGKLDFIYLPRPTELKGIDCRTLTTFLLGKREALIPGGEKWQVMLHHALHHKLVILDDFFINLPPSEINEILTRLKDKNIFFLVITADYYMTRALVRNNVDIYYLKSDASAAPILDENFGPV